MVKKQRDKAPKSAGKPKHSNDANRANKRSKNGMRDAATVSRRAQGAAKNMAPRNMACGATERCSALLKDCVDALAFKAGFAAAAEQLQLTPLQPACATAAYTAPALADTGINCKCPPALCPLQVRRLEMYNSKAKRDKNGRIISQDFQSKELPTTRIHPDRRWFGNTRVIGQKQLEAFREEMGAKVADPYTVLIREKKLPLSLLEDPEKKGAGGWASEAGGVVDSHSERKSGGVVDSLSERKSSGWSTAIASGWGRCHAC